MTIAAPSAILTGIQVTAHNLANATTPGFEPSHVIFQAGPTGQIRAHVEHPRHRQEQLDGEPESGDLPPSGTDVPGEMVNLMRYQHTYSASLKVIQAQDDSIGHLLDMIS